MRVAIIGSRSIKRADILKYIPKETDTIITGGAVGIDSIAAKTAGEQGIFLIVYPPDYKTYGKAAPLIRNKKIVDDCDMLIAFWDGISRGTVFTIKYAKSKGKPVKIYKSVR